MDLSNAQNAIMNSGSERRLLALIVDDEVSLRKALSRFLDVLGIDWIDTDDESALEMFLDSRFRIHVVFLDVKMPRVDGYTLIAQIRRRSSTMPVVFCTSSPVAEVLANVVWMKPHFTCQSRTRYAIWSRFLRLSTNCIASKHAAQDR